MKVTGSGKSTVELLPDSLGEKWRATGPPRALNSAEWIILPDADVYGEYGLQRLISRIYSDGTTKASIEIFEMSYASGAFGLFTFNRNSLSSNRQEFHAGRYLVSIAGERNDKPIDPILIESLKKQFASELGQLPFLPSHLPEQHKIAGSEKYLIGSASLARVKGFSDLKDVINFEGGVEAITADYQNGIGRMSLIIVEYHTPQTATEGLLRASRYFESLSPSEKERRIFKRVGNYVVQAINVNDHREAAGIVNQIKYNPKVYWEGQKLSDIPIAFRPPDPAAVEEATKTMKILIRSFYWIGAMLSVSILLGMVAGGFYFYWRRYRRRKLGLEDIFSDAGGSVRLNLNAYLLPPGESSVKQIGDGKQ
ncbi:MAG: hypothetical protein L0226_01065 [Acidobacteria bacterium]|nr:hypothetical protein [Acidobacteriota bacterium]